jgi:hypothetical protein
MSYIHDQQPERDYDELFGEVIDSYTDAEALEDGVLVELYMPARFQEFPINRMTRHLFDDLAPFVEAEASLSNGDVSRALASILSAKCAFAQGDLGNTGEIGDICTIPPKLWLVRNEVAAGLPCTRRTTNPGAT